MELRPGLLIAQNVQLVRLLGQGGMGSIWVADHLTLHVQVAVKFISAALAQDPEAVGRFTREATSAARIRSPHVVQIFDHGVLDGIPYIVMEMLQGEDLDRRLKRQKPLGLVETVTILQQIGKALSDAHALGIIHRDIKPSNVFLTQSAGEVFVKLLDFGIAKQTDAGPGGRMTATGQAVGTPGYMSPEQLFTGRGEVDHRSDLWGLAVLVHQCVTGVLPFEGKTLGDLSLAIHQGTFEPPSRRRPGLTPALDAWFRRALERDPTRRFGTAREFVDTFMEAARATPEWSAPALYGRQESEGVEVFTAASAASEAIGALPRVAPQTFAGTSTGKYSPAAPRRGVLVGVALALAAVFGLALLLFGRIPRSAPQTAEAVPMLDPAAASPGISAGSPASYGASAAQAPSPPAKADGSPDDATVPAPPVITPAELAKMPAKTSAAPATTPAAPAKTPAVPAKTPAAPATTPAAPAKTSAAPATTGPKRRDHGF